MLDIGKAASPHRCATTFYLQHHCKSIRKAATRKQVISQDETDQGSNKASRREPGTTFSYSGDARVAFCCSFLFLRALFLSKSCKICSRIQLLGRASENRSNRLWWYNWNFRGPQYNYYYPSSSLVLGGGSISCNLTPKTLNSSFHILFQYPYIPIYNPI